MMTLGLLLLKFCALVTGLAAVLVLILEDSMR